MGGGDIVKISSTSGKAVTIDSKEEYNIYGKNISIEADTGEIVRSNGGTLNIGKNDTQKITFTAKSADAVNALPSNGPAIINITAKEILIDTTGAGIWAQNNTENPTAPTDHTTVNVKANKTTINSGTLGIVAYSNSEINIEGDITVNAPTAISTRGYSSVNINKNKKYTVQINGNISFETPGQSANSGKYIDSYVNINLVGPNSYWNGNATYEYPSGQDAYPATTEVKGFALNIQNGASWTPTKLDITSGEGQKAGQLAIPKVTLNNGVINLKEGVEAAVVDLSGSGTVNLGTNGASSGKLTVTSGKGSSLNVNLMNSDLSKSLTADDVTADEAKALLENVGGKNSGVSTKTDVAEGMVNPAFNVDATGAVKTAQANTLMQSSLALATAAPLSLNRIMMNDVRKRLGDIRTSSGTNGAWARYDGGKLSGEGGLETDFNTIQVGFDTMPTPDAVRLGLAFSYTDGDADYARGSADMKAYGLAAYGTWLGQNGQFADIVARLGKADTDMRVDGTHNGSIKNYALSLSGEFGWRFDLTNAVYLEPQVEATYTYVNGDDLKLGTAKYDVDSVDSFMTRAGLAAGLKCPNEKGNVYVRASVVHEFLGDAKISAQNGSVSNTYETNGEDTWVEYGLGINANLTKSTYMWADVERTSGGALDEDWRATVGVRYAW